MVRYTRPTYHTHLQGPPQWLVDLEKDELRNGRDVFDRSVIAAGGRAIEYLFRVGPPPLSAKHNPYTLWLLTNMKCNAILRDHFYTIYKPQYALDRDEKHRYIRPEFDPCGYGITWKALAFNVMDFERLDWDAMGMKSQYSHEPERFISLWDERDYERRLLFLLRRCCKEPGSPFARFFKDVSAREVNSRMVGYPLCYEECYTHLAFCFDWIKAEISADRWEESIVPDMLGLRVPPPPEIVNEESQSADGGISTLSTKQAARQRVEFQRKHGVTHQQSFQKPTGQHFDVA